MTKEKETIIATVTVTIHKTKKLNSSNDSKYTKPNF